MTNVFPVLPQPRSPAAEVLLVLSKYDSDIEELRQASRLPSSRFPLDYGTDKPYSISLPHLAGIRKCARVLRLRACAELGLGQTQKALDDVRLSLRLGEAVQTEPFLISQLVRISILNLATQPVWEGLKESKWSEQQLSALEDEFKRPDFVADYRLHAG